ncbi:hypothetical protein; putative exported protein [Cupriavidus taiwanensis LMG 19424]|uniref:Uncharacterized protein n=1 Tax=Cupriavidus taiwanensis (strain DSM 17343 / BCRC 17206 / CCUG 44338 / CIP 107171 / LMG 19424 / R1) TaxID=977880 RepID=B3R9T0_CUPTR|nr:hypothetical protein; putative exported protein [Cupriavidus taiwanensis LMG 19424]
MLSVKVPSAAVVAVPLPFAHLAWTVAPPNAAPTAAVPVIFVAAGAVAVESPPPPPQAVSTAAARPVKNRCFAFIPVLISVVFLLWQGAAWWNTGSCRTPPTGRLTRPAGAIFREIPDGAQPALR